VEQVRVAIFGLGTVGKEVARALLTKKGVSIVCVVDKGDAVGQDLGSVLGMERLGVQVSSDAGAIAAARAQVVIQSTATKVKDVYNQMKEILQSGCNVITAAEEMVSPFVYDKEYAGLIDELAKQHKASVLGTGLWPTWMDIDLPLLLSTGTRSVSYLKYARNSNFRPYMGSVVAKHFGVGFTRAEFEAGLESGQIVGHVGFEGSYDRLGHYFGWNIDSIDKLVEPVYGVDGRTSGVITSAIGREKGVLRIEMSLHANTTDDWVTSDIIEVHGTPNVHMTIKPSLAGTVPVANVLVNQIPFALQAKPGIVLKSSVGSFCYADLALIDGAPTL
jgi:4-hydroxy-tetrahydrodipicolinate reductase